MATQPPVMSPQWRKERASKAAKARWTKHSTEAMRRTNVIAKLIETAPPLTSEQIERLRALLPAAAKGANR